MVLPGQGLRPAAHASMRPAFTGGCWWYCAPYLTLPRGLWYGRWYCQTRWSLYRVRHVLQLSCLARDSLAAASLPLFVSNVRACGRLLQAIEPVCACTTRSDLPARSPCCLARRCGAHCSGFLGDRAGQPQGGCASSQRQRRQPLRRHLRWAADPPPAAGTAGSGRRPRHCTSGTRCSAGCQCRPGAAGLCGGSCSRVRCCGGARGGRPLGCDPPC